MQQIYIQAKNNKKQAEQDKEQMTEYFNSTNLLYITMCSELDNIRNKMNSLVYNIPLYLYYRRIYNNLLKKSYKLEIELQKSLDYVKKSTETYDIAISAVLDIELNDDVC